MPRSSVVRCSKCREWKQTSEFSPNTRKVNGLASWCKQCVNQQHKQTYDAAKRNREKGLA